MSIDTARFRTELLAERAEMSWHPTRGAGLLASVPNTTSPLGDAAEAVAFPTLACLLERRARVSAERPAVKAINGVSSLWTDPTRLRFMTSMQRC